MKHLLKVMKNKGKAPSRKCPNKCFFDNSKYICYQINGFWFRMNQAQWADFREIPRSTMTYRLKNGCTTGQALQFEPIPHRFYSRKTQSKSTKRR